MNTLITAALNASDITPLAQFPLFLMNPFEIDQVTWIKEYVEKYGATPTVDRLRRQFEHFIPLASETPDPLWDEFDATVKRKRREYAVTAMTTAIDKIQDGEESPIDAIAKIQANMEASRPTTDDLTGTTIGSVFTPGPEIEWDIAGISRKYSLNGIFGDFATGKTWLASDMLVSYALGEDWFGRKVRGGRVLYITEDNDEVDIRMRLRALLKARGISEEQAKDIPFVYLALRGINLGTSHGMVAMKKAIEVNQADMTVLDTWSAAIAGLNEDKSQDIQPVINFLRKTTSELHTTFWIIHHENKSGGYRGSSALAAGLDNLLQVKKQKDSNELSIEMTKRRYGGDRNLNLEMIFEGDDPYIPEKVSFAQIDKASEMPPSGWLKKAIAALKEKPNQTSQDLANALGTSNENLRKYISGWAKNGYIEVSPIKTGRAFTYRVAKDGEALL